MDHNSNLVEALNALERSKKMADALNQMSAIFLSNTAKTFNEVMTAGLGLIADVADLDRLSIWHNHTKLEGLYTSQVYRWDRSSGGITPPLAELANIAHYDFAPNWEGILARNEALNGPVKLLPGGNALARYGTLSAFVSPIFLNDILWGFVIFCDQRSEHYFDEEIAQLLRSAASLSANAIVRAEMERELADALLFNKTVINSAPVGFILFDADVRILDCNDEILKICNTTRQHFSAHFFEFSPDCQLDGQKSSDKARALVQQVMTDGKTVVTEWFHQDSEGETIPCELTMFRVKTGSQFKGCAYIYDLRKSKKLEADVLRAARINRSILDSLPIGMAVFNATPQVTECNSKLAEMFGASKQQVIERYFDDFSPEFLPNGKKTRDEAYDIMNRTIAGETVRAEWPHHTASGEPLPCDITLSRVKGEDDFIGIGFLYDLREVKNLTRDLYEQSVLLKALNSVSAALLDPDERFGNTLKKAMGILAEAVEVDRICVWKNRTDESGLFCSLICEWDFGLFRKKKGGSLLAADQRYDNRTIWQDTLSKGLCVNSLANDLPLDLQAQLRSRNVFSIFLMPVFLQDKFWGFVGFDNCRKNRLFTENEELILRSASRAIVNAISHNRIKARLKSSVKEAREINKQKNIAIKSLESILDGIDALVYITKPATGEMLFVNRYLLNAFNMASEDMIGKYCYSVLRGLNEKCDFCPCYKLDDNPDQSIIWDDYVASLKMHIRHSDCYIDWPTGEKVHLQQAVDITELIRAREQAEQSNRSKSEFLSHMSHEIRTPMNAILGIAEIQLQGENLYPDTREALGKIYESGDLLLNIINDILDISKIESGKLELLPVKYDIPSLVNDTAQLNRLRYEAKPILFTLHIGEDTPFELIGDELRIKQVLNNILSNAFKYTDEGKVDFSVSIEKGLAGPGGVMLVFKVTDTGQGMSEDQLDRLFDEYARFNLEKNRNTVGAGLGMHITKQLVEFMDGTITVKSVVGKGTEFIVRIPQKKANDVVCGADMVHKLKNFCFKSNAIMQRTQFVREYMPYGSVLVVDDVESNIYVAKGMLMPYGLSIETASSAFEAIDKIKDGKVYDIIFMDHMMPEMDGIKATKILRSMGYKHTIVALTANTLIGLAQMFIQNGFDGFISKPIDSRELNVLLNDFIRSKKPPEVVKAAQREQREKIRAAAASSMSDAKGLAGEPGPGETALDKRDPEKERFFIRDAENALNVLKGMNEKQFRLDQAEIDTYTITVHGIKAVLSNMGEKDLSNLALRLEKAAVDGDIASILIETPLLMSSLQSLIAKLSPAKVSGGAELSDEEAKFLNEKLLKFKKACSEFHITSAKEVLTELRQRTWPDRVNALIDELSMHILHSAFRKATTVAEGFIK